MARFIGAIFTNTVGMPRTVYSFVFATPNESVTIAGFGEVHEPVPNGGFSKQRIKNSKRIVELLQGLQTLFTSPSSVTKTDF